ncbi:MAG: hydantoinase/oxoprolinase family protein [Ardenticatenaceae bacterium]|nr:hydantoinase/oxoprolinase family protein [Ardenticatenaceae bacterium]
MITSRTILGVDTGGTFTDFVWVTPQGDLTIYKERSTPHDPSIAILAGISTLNISAEAAVVHGSTVATNALLERRGAKTALIATKGFRDVLAIGRQNRPHIYDLVPQKPAALVPQQWRFEVMERLAADGTIITPLDIDQLPSLFTQITDQQIESLAISLLFSYLDGRHERKIAEALKQWIAQNDPDYPLSISLSCDILPEYREYERTSTTVINAYVAPLMSRYLARLDKQIAPRPLAIMQSNGGLIRSNTAGAQAARTALSGPAGGVVGAMFVAREAGFKEIITFDMGGTSSDVALCPGRLPTTTRGAIADMPLRLPIIDIHTVGAGGGSIAYFDAGGALHVGPESAGADPGPACYPRVSNQASPLQPTVTDANLLLGRLDPDRFLGGTMSLDVTAAETALTPLAMDNSLPQAAWGIIQVANAHMERAIRKISVERGHDPREFVLVPFGGAGPLHACEMAENLNINTVLIPPIPGVLSALGMLVASPTKDYSQTILRPLSRLDTTAELREEFSPLIARAQSEMAQEGHDPDKLQLVKTADMRYRGQSHELAIQLGEDLDNLVDLLHDAHQMRYGYHQPDEDVELVTIRLTAISPAKPPALPTYLVTTQPLEEAVYGQKAVWFGGQAVDTTLYDRHKLQHGHSFSGPAVVFQYDSTIVIPPRWQARVDQFGNLILRYEIRD